MCGTNDRGLIALEVRVFVDAHHDVVDVVSTGECGPKLVCEKNNAPFDLGAEWIQGRSPEGNRLFVCGEVGGPI